jgi:hypothetical protein
MYCRAKFLVVEDGFGGDDGWGCVAEHEIRWVEVHEPNVELREYDIRVEDCWVDISNTEFLDAFERVNTAFKESEQRRDSLLIVGN